MEKDALLGEVQSVLSSVPDVLTAFDQHTQEADAWVGRASAVIRRWDKLSTSATLVIAQQKLRSFDMGDPFEGLRMITTLLYQAEADLKMDLGRSSVVIESGQVFRYFEEVKKLVEGAKVEVFFVDPYLDAEVVSNYFTYLAAGVRVRMLGRNNIAKLVPAVEMFCRQSGHQVEVRSSNAIHDRYVFLDGKEGHFSGASFKDGAKKAPVVIAQVFDAFQVTLDIYQQAWDKGTVHR